MEGISPTHNRSFCIDSVDGKNREEKQVGFNWGYSRKLQHMPSMCIRARNQRASSTTLCYVLSIVVMVDRYLADGVGIPSHIARHFFPMAVAKKITLL